MAFIEHKPTRSSAGDYDSVRNAVRVSFKKSQTKDLKNAKTLATFYLGKEVTLKAGINQGDKVKFFYDDIDKRKWMIKKSLNGSGYRLVDVGTIEKTSNYLRFQMTWRVPDFNLEEKDMGVKIVAHEVLNDEILINAT